MINVALPKGRLGEKVYGIMQEMGYGCEDSPTNCRKLVFTSANKEVSYFWVKPSDVAVYVEMGAADAGVVGKDVIDEHSPDVYELADLNAGKCNMCVAAKRGYVEDAERPLKVATKFVRTAAEYYASCGRDIEIIKLNGSIELAPILGLSDVIVDIVETGATLKENDLEVIKVISSISARFIANKSAYLFKREEIDAFTKKLLARVGND